MKRTRNFGLFLGLVISAIALFYALRGLDWAAFFEHLKKTNLLYVPLLLLLFFLSFYIKALRWRYLLPSVQPLKTSSLYHATVIGTLASLILPLRAGEFIRPWVLSRSSAVKFSTGFASVVTERVFDVLAMLTILAFCLLRLDNVPEIALLGAKALGALAAVIMFAMLLAYFRAVWVLRPFSLVVNAVFKKRYPALAEKLLEMATDFVQGLRAISNFKELLLVLFWSYILWLEFALFYHVSFRAFGITPDFWVACTTNSMIAIAIAVPSAPGFVGTFQSGTRLALTDIFHYPADFSLAVSIFAHAFQLLAILLFGLISLRLEGLRFSELETSKQK